MPTIGYPTMGIAQQCHIFRMKRPMPPRPRCLCPALHAPNPGGSAHNFGHLDATRPCHSTNVAAPPSIGPPPAANTCQTAPPAAPTGDMALYPRVHRPQRLEYAHCLISDRTWGHSTGSCRYVRFHEPVFTICSRVHKMYDPVYRECLLCVGKLLLSSR